LVGWFGATKKLLRGERVVTTEVNESSIETTKKFEIFFGRGRPEVENCGAKQRLIVDDCDSID
jgi:hypothetical protein